MRHNPCVIIICILGLLLQGCIIREEGCLDPNAFNYDISADQSCMDCCTYPDLLINWTPKWNGLNFSTSDTLIDAAGHSYKITDIRILLQNWRWYDLNGIEYKVEPEFWPCGDSEIEVTPDFMEIVPTNFTYRVGDVKTFPTVENIRFSFGTTFDFQCLDTLDVTTPRMLTSYGNFWNKQTQELAAIRLVIDADLDGQDNDTLFIPSQIDIELPHTFASNRGQNINFRLTVDYGKWFMSARIDDYSTFQTSFLNGLAGSITQTP